MSPETGFEGDRITDKEGILRRKLTLGSRLVGRRPARTAVGHPLSFSGRREA